MGGDTEGITAAKSAFKLLTPKEMKAMAKALPEYVMVVEQRHGDVVELHPGWVHCVYNERPSIKVAFNQVRLDQLALVALMQVEVGCKLIGQRASEDYINVTDMAARMLADLLGMPL